MLIPSYHTFKNFKFQSGAILNEVRLEYATLGKVRRDSEGNIVNSILFLHGWSGNYSSFKRFNEFTKPGQVFDKDRYFIICTTALGSPESSAPSTSTLSADFPTYTIEDMVNAQHRLLTEHLNVKHLRGIIGTSMGGFQTLDWGIRYPEFMDFIIPIVTSPSVQGRNLAIFNLMNSIIQKHPDYNKGFYQENPGNAVENANKLLFLFAFSPLHYHEEFPSKEMLIHALDEQGIQGRMMDANDVIWRNNASISFDVREKLSKIKAKTLVIGIDGDQFFPPDIDTISLSQSINDSKLFIYNSVLGHLGINELKKARRVIEDFISRN